MRLIALFFLAMISFNAVTAVSLRKNAVEATKTSYAIERLRFIGKKSTVAHEIIAAVELHLTSGGKVDEVIQLVQDALDDVVSRRQSLQNEYNERRTSLENVLAQAHVDLTNAQDRHAVVGGEINRLVSEIDVLNNRIHNLHEELASLDQREVQVNEAREIDVRTYEARRQRDQNALTVLDQIVQKLQNLQQRGNSFLQVSMKEIQRALNRIPKTNPIQALVQLSTKFDAERLAQVVGKLQQIQNAVQQSANEDSNGEENSRQHYVALVEEIQQIRAQKQAELAQAEADKQAAEVELNNYETEWANLEVLIQTTQNIIVETQAELDSVNASYTARINEANLAVQAIEAAVEVLRQHADELQNRENVADAQ